MTRCQTSQSSRRTKSQGISRVQMSANLRPKTLGIYSVRLRSRDQGGARPLFLEGQRGQGKEWEGKEGNEGRRGLRVVHPGETTPFQVDRVTGETHQTTTLPLSFPIVSPITTKTRAMCSSPLDSRTPCPRSSPQPTTIRPINPTTTVPMSPENEMPATSRPGSADIPIYTATY